ncbi:MAG: glycosyltransferase [Oscillospiraceae bacterium]|nr:glycosyltransferase [Oscillospiraceae bacterium]
MKVSLVIPAYNESKIIPDTIRAVSAKLAELTEEYEVLIVDDGSTDGMGGLVENCGDRHVRLERYTPNHGKGRAVRTGMLAAKGDVILCTDADLAYGVDVFAVILERFVQGDADLVIGSRRIGPDGYKSYPPIRLLTSKCFGFLVKLASGLTYDTQCGIKGYRRQAARDIYSKCTTDGFSFDFEVLMRADKLGLKVDQIPVSVVNFRESKVSIVKDSYRMFRDLFRIRRTVRSGDV